MLARVAIDEFTQLAAKKTPFGSMRLLRDRPVVAFWLTFGIRRFGRRRRVERTVAFFFGEARALESHFFTVRSDMVVDNELVVALPQLDRIACRPGDGLEDPSLL